MNKYNIMTQPEVALEKGSLDGSQGTSFPKVRVQVFVVIVGKGIILNFVQHD